MGRHLVGNHVDGSWMARLARFLEEMESSYLHLTIDGIWYDREGITFSNTIFIEEWTQLNTI